MSYLSKSNSNRIGNTIGLLGDSYSSLHKGGTGLGVTTPNTGFFHWANSRLNKKFHIVHYGGVSGETTTEIKARIKTDCLDMPIAWANIQGGINDVSTSISASTIVSNLISMYDQCRANGINVIGYTIPIITLWSGNQTKLNIAHDVNAQLKQYARKTKNFILIDWNLVLMNQSTGLMNTNYTYDSTHLSLLGCAIAGDLIYQKLQYVVDQVDMLPMCSNDEYSVNTGSAYTNLVPNPMLTGNSSGLCTSWFPNVTLASGGSGVLSTDYSQSKVAASGYRNFEWQQFTAITASGTEKRFAFRPSTSAMAGRWSTGDYLYVECEYETDLDWTSCTRFELRLNTLVSSGNAPNAIDGYTNGTTNGVYPTNGSPNTYQPRAGVFRTYPVQMTSLVTSVYPEFQFYAVAGTIRVGRFAIKKATAVTVGSNTIFLY